MTLKKQVTRSTMSKNSRVIEGLRGGGAELKPPSPWRICAFFLVEGQRRILGADPQGGRFNLTPCEI